MSTLTSFNRSRVTLAAVGLAAAVGLTLAGCGTAGPSGPATSASATMWSLVSGDQPVLQAAVDRWNRAHPTQKITVDFFATDAYKAKIRTAVGAGQAPTLIFNWSGGVLKSYVKAGAVEDLSKLLAQKPEVGKRYIPSVLQNGVVNGKTYALPMNKVNPATMYFNNDLLKRAGVTPPKTWDELVAAIPKLKALGVAPIALGGQSKWPELIWLEYLVDREGGTAVWDKILSGAKGAWSNPAVLDALSKIQQLVDAGAFQDSFASTASNSGSELALLYTGRAAMNLQISSQYQVIKTGAPDFIAKGTLGFAPFPAVDGGTGDSSVVVGTPANFFSVSAAATEAQKQTAEAFLSSGLFDSSYTKGLIDSGAVPALNGIKSKLSGTRDSKFLDYVYGLSSKASTFQLSWDQALDPSISDALLTNLAQVFLKQQTPQQFVDAMNQASAK